MAFNSSSSGSVPSATSSVRGKVKLAGDLGGTADVPRLSSSLISQGAVGDGNAANVAADTAAFLTLASSGLRVTSPPKKTYIINSGITLTNGTIFDLNGSTIKIQNGATAGIIVASSSAGSQLHNFIFDGNRGNGAVGLGIDVRASGLVTNVESSNHSNGSGFTHLNSPDVTYTNCVANGNGAATATSNGANDGFNCNNGRMRLRACRASANGNCGVFITQNAQNGCEVDLLEADGNLNAAADIRSNYGFGRTIRASGSGHYGVLFGSPPGGAFPSGDGWQIDAIDVRSMTDISFGEAVHFYGARHLSVGHINAFDCQSYGVAFGNGADRGDAYGGACVNVSIGIVNFDNIADPGINYTSAYGCTIGVANLSNCAAGVNFGEGSGSFVQNNSIGLVEANACPFAVISFLSTIGNAASLTRNYIGRVHAVNCSTVSGYQIVLYDYASGNRIGQVESHTAVGVTKPDYIVGASANSSNNRIGKVVSTDFNTAMISDAGSNNNFFGDLIVDHPTCRVFNSTAIAVSSGVVTPTVLTFNSERFDTDGIHSTASNTSRLTCNTPGVYSIFANVLFDASGAGTVRIAQVRLNGTTLIGEMRLGPVSGGALGTSVAFNTPYKLAIGDYVELIVYQDSGGSLNVLAIPSITPEFGMTRVASA
jgi:hypothetical protein